MMRLNRSNTSTIYNASSNLMYCFTQSLIFIIVFGQLFERKFLKCLSLRLFNKAVITDETIKSGARMDYSLKQAIKALSDSSFFYYKAIKFTTIFIGFQLLAK